MFFISPGSLGGTTPDDVGGGLWIFSKRYQPARPTFSNLFFCFFFFFLYKKFEISHSLFHNLTQNKMFQSEQKIKNPAFTHHPTIPPLFLSPYPLLSPFPYPSFPLPSRSPTHHRRNDRSYCDDSVLHHPPHSGAARG